MAAQTVAVHGSMHREPGIIGADLVSELERPIETWDPAFYLLTSGTTGPSKLAIVTYRNIYAGVLCSVPLSRGHDDCVLVDLPLFHGGALRLAMGALSFGARMAILAKPRMSTYWRAAGGKRRYAGTRLLRSGTCPQRVKQERSGHPDLSATVMQ